MNASNVTRIAAAMNETIAAVVAKTNEVSDGGYLQLVKGTESTVHHQLLQSPSELRVHVLGARFVDNGDDTQVAITVYDTNEAAQADFIKVDSVYAACIDNVIGLRVSNVFGNILKEVTVALGVALI